MADQPTERAGALMQIIPTDLPEVLIIEPKVIDDERKRSMESYNRRAFNDAVGYVVDFVQDNHSRSARGVLRGLHYQLPPRAQELFVTSGRAFDVAVASAANHRISADGLARFSNRQKLRQLWIPVGFAHGFLALEDDTDFLYKTTDHYSREHEGCIAWNDTRIGIAWPELDANCLRLAAKDAAAPGLNIAALP